MKQKDFRPTAHLVCGFIGAGKTTFAKKLEKETGAIRFTKDEWLIKIFGNDPKSITNFECYDERVSDLSVQIAFDCLDRGLDIIIDDGLWVKSQRAQMIEKIRKAGAKPQLYYVQCPIEIMKSRTVCRSDDLPSDSFKIDEEMFDSYVKYWQPPGEDEDFILIESK